MKMVLWIKTKTYLSEYFCEAPVGNVRLLVGLEDEDLATEGADSDEAAVGVPGEALDTWQDTIGGASSRLGSAHFC